MKRLIDEERKRQIVKKVKDRIPFPEVCKSEGVSRSALYRWIQLYTSQKRWGANEPIDLQKVYRMERRLATLEEELKIFRKSGCGTKSSIDEKIAAIEALKGEFTTYVICRTLKILRSTYYQRKKGNGKTWFDAKNEVLRPVIKAYFDESGERFGASKIIVKLRQAGFIVSQKHVSKLMSEMGLICKQSRLRVFNSTNRSYRYRKNRLQQNFTVVAPNKVWGSDIIYMRVNEDFVSVCVIIDLYARKVVSYAISKNGNTALVKETFQKAYDLRCPDEGLIFHSDQGTIMQHLNFGRCCGT